MTEPTAEVAVPLALLYDGSLTPAAKIAWAAMHAYCVETEKPVDFAVIALALGTSTSAAARWYWRLEEAGWIRNGWTWGSGWPIEWWRMVDARQAEKDVRRGARTWLG